MGNISVDYDVLNQKGSPAWYSDVYANIPAPGYKGRMFISTDTYAFYRDNGTGWDLVGGPGTGTITGSGASGQVTYFNGSDTIGGSNNLFWDITNARLGINTATPGAPLDIHSTGTAAQFNGTGVNNSFVLFQNAGTSKWRIGNLYNSGANDYQIFDVTNSIARLTIKNTGASTLIGTFTATSLIKSGGTNLQILLADGSTTPTSSFGTGSVTNVSALTIGTTGTDLTSSVVNSSTTPVITLNVPTASATNRGALSSTDWTTFNNKQATITLTTTGTSGAATLIGSTLNIPNYTNVGTVTYVSVGTGEVGTNVSANVTTPSTTPLITINIPIADATNTGKLSNTDWTIFNSKQATISVTSPVVLTGSTISMPVASTGVSGYLSSTDWNTFNNKSNTNGTVTSVAALTLGTTGVDLSSSVATGTTTPVITLNVPTASATNRGALSSTDWTTFNGKVGGSGTTGTIPKFVSTTGLGNSLLSESGTAMTIGGSLNINAASGTGLNVAGNTIVRGDTGVGTPRQLLITAGGGTPVYLEAKGYGANYVTDFGIKVMNNAGTQYTSIYSTGGNGYVGIGTNTPGYLLDINGNVGAAGTMIANNYQTSLAYGLAYSANNSSTALHMYSQYSNTSAILQFGVEGSAGGAIFPGTSAYASVIGTTSPRSFQIATNNAVAMTIASSGVANFNNYILTDNSILIKNGFNTSATGYTGIGSVATGLTINLGTGTTGSLLFNTGSSYSYTFPAASGTLALTSSLSSYLPLTGGTLTGALTINSSRPQAILTSNGTTGLYIRDATGSGYKSWSIGTNDIVVGFAITPSTAVGGTTFTTPSFVINESGNVGIGTSSPGSYILALEYGISAAAVMSIKNSSASGYSGAHLLNSSGTLIGHFGYANASTGAPLTDKVYFGSIAAKDVVFTTNDSVKMTLTSVGAINFNSASIYTAAGCVNSEVSTSNDFIFSGLNTNATNPRGLYLRNSATTGGDYAIYFEAAGASKFYVNGNGAISSTSTLITLISSDFNLKTDIRDYDKGLNEILAMKPRYYKFKDNLNVEETGFIAQEMEAALPNSMIDVKDSLDSDTTHKSYQINWYPILVKAIQELNDKLVRNNIN